MRRLSPRVNVIPVIGKADSLTPTELRGFKKRVCSAPWTLFVLLAVSDVSRVDVCNVTDHGRYRVL